jgi:hypothetical protein
MKVLFILVVSSILFACANVEPCGENGTVDWDGTLSGS